MRAIEVVTRTMAQAAYTPVAKLWNWFLAYTRLSLDAVCEMSDGLDMDADYHNYTDTADKVPHPFDRHECERCGKHFFI